MITTPRPMPAEYLHSTRCQASAMISAVQNLRDQDSEHPHDFRMAMQDGYALTIADEYLTTGTADCICHHWDLATTADGLAHGVCSCGWEGMSVDDQFAAAAHARQHTEDAISAAWALVSA